MAGPPAGVARRAVLLVAVSAGYYLGARVGLHLSLIEENVTPLWPPTGIALAAFLVFGRWLWPGIAVAALLVNLPISTEVAAAAATAVGNVLAPLVAATALQRLGFDRQLVHKRDASLIVFVGALASMLISATIGALTLVASGAIDDDRFLAAWAVWWTGDAMGVLTVAPVLLALPLFREQEHWTSRQWLEAALFLVGVAIAVDAGLHADLPMLFPGLPLVGWAAWRLQLRGAAPAALVVSVLVTWHASHEHGMFAGVGLFDRMLTLQGFNACVALTSFILAAMVSERMETTRALREATLLLEARVEEEVSGRSREHQVAETLQRALLPDSLPAVPGAQVAVRYVPASADLRVGGDWYDVVRLPSGSVGLVIGDVAGHGLAAAGVMGQLRMALRAYAHQDPSPSAVLGGLQQLVAQLPGSAMATVLYLVFDPSSRRLTFANAGHPPPLRIAGGRAEFLGEALSPPIGARKDGDYPESGVDLDPGTTLLLYTDGLVERRNSSIDDQLALLRHHAASGTDPEELCDRLLRSMLDGAPVQDDVALLVVRLDGGNGAPMRMSLPAEARELVHLRVALRRWMQDAGVAAADADDVLLACGEACSNVVEHAYAGVPGTIDLQVSLEDATIEVVVRDRGVWRPETPRGGGWGLDLARSLMDDVEVSGGSEGTRVTLRRAVRRDAAS